MILLFFLVAIASLLWSAYRFVAYRQKDCRGKTVLVTGATSPLGVALCRAWSRAGAHIIAWDYSRGRLEELKVALQLHEPSDAPMTRGGQEDSTSSAADVLTYKAIDLASRAQIRQAINELPDCVDIVIHVALVRPNADLESRDGDSCDRVLSTNLLLPMLLAKGVMPRMMERRVGGQWVTVVPTGAAVGHVDAHPDFCASQWGLQGLHYSLRHWATQHHRRTHTPGTVRSTLIYLDDHLWERHGTRSPESSVASRRGGDGSGVDSPSSRGTGAARHPHNMEEVAESCLSAVSRSVERMSMTTWGHGVSLSLLLPIPWAEAIMEWSGAIRGHRR